MVNVIDINRLTVDLFIKNTLVYAAFNLANTSQSLMLMMQRKRMMMLNLDTALGLSLTFVNKR